MASGCDPLVHIILNQLNYVSLKKKVSEKKLIISGAKNFCCENIEIIESQKDLQTLYGNV